MDNQNQIDQFNQAWAENPRWKGILRDYTAEEVVRLSGSIQLEHTLARLGAERLWELLHSEPYVQALGALTGNQAVQQVQAGLKAIYVSGWQIAADANSAAQMYPDQSLYPVDSAPQVIKRINQSLLRADQIQHMSTFGSSPNGLVNYLAPIVADAEAGFGGPLNTFELVKMMIEAGAAGVHLEDQVSSLKKCGHMGGKVLEPVSTHIRKLIAARLAADVSNVPALIIARTDAEDAQLLRSDIDPVDQRFLTGDRSYEGYYYIRGGVEMAIERGRAYAPYVDMIWCETKKPDLGEAREFAQGIHEKFPGKILAYNCSPSFNWKRHMSEKEMAEFQEKLAELGYKFQFVTLAGFHTLNASMFDLASSYKEQGMSAYSKVQEREFELERTAGYKATRHQSFVGAGYFDEVLMTITERQSETSALKGSTEEEQFSETFTETENLPMQQSLSSDISEQE